MKIAFCLFKYFPFGGLQRDFRGISDECVARGHQVDVYVLEWHGEKPTHLNITIVPTRGLTNHRRYYNFANDIGKLLATHDYDIVIGFNKMPYLDIYYAADPCYEAMARRLRHRFYRLSPRYRHFASMERAVVGPGSTTKLLVIAEMQQRDFHDYYLTPNERFYLLPPWITLDRLYPENQQAVRQQLRQEFGIAESDYLVLMIGSGFKTKGLDRAIAAVASLPPSIKQKTHFIVIGHDKPTPFQRMAKTFGVAENITILGGRTDVPRFLFSADVLLHPAYNESAGIVLLEAIVAGLPVLVTDVCGYAFHVQQSQAGMIVPTPFSQDTLNNYLHTMLTSPERNNWRDNGIAYGKQQYFSNMPKQAVDTIEKLSEEIYCVRQPNILLKIRNDLRARWQSDDIFSEIMALEGEVFRALDGRRTLRFSHEDKNYFAKIHEGVGWQEIFKNFLQLRFPVLGAKNEWMAIERLEQLKIDTMKVVAYGMKGRNPASLKSFIITEALPNTVSLEDFCCEWQTSPPSFKLKLALIKKVAWMARCLHTNGVNHRDFYICHLLLRIDNINHLKNYDDLTIFLIDLHRVQIRKETPRRWIIKDMGSLYFSVMDIGLTQRDILRFMKYYRQRPLHSLLTDEYKFWKQVQRRGIQLYHKGHKHAPTLPVEI